MGASGNEPACQCRRHKKPGFDPWVGKIPWRRKWQPHFLENPMGRRAWWVTVHGVAKSQTGLKRLSASTPYCLPQERATSSLMLFVYPAHMSLVMLILLSLFICVHVFFYLLILSSLETSYKLFANTHGLVHYLNGCLPFLQFYFSEQINEQR